VKTHPRTTPDLEPPLASVKFESFPIPEPVLQAIREAGFVECTPIQAQTLPITLKGRDVAGQAQTGTGKTAAFLIAIFSHLLQNPRDAVKDGGRVAPRALVIAPTRELARQIEIDARLLGKHCGLQIVCVYGGMDYEKQKLQIQEGVDLMIVTPGRLIDYYKQKFFSLKSVEVLVIDEADRMFDMGFIADIRYILRNTTPYNKRLSMLYSATLNFRVMELCYEHMNDPVPIKIEPEKMVVDEVTQLLYHVGSHEKFNLLLGLLKIEGGKKILIFTNTKWEAEKLELKLNFNDYAAGVISGDLPQRKRIAMLEKFMKGELPILIATDVASRGLHIENVTHVINYDLPQDAEDYIHRIGRTARAGATGDAISLACEDYAVNLERIEETLKKKIPVEWPEDSMFIPAKEGTPKSPPRRRTGGPRDSRGPRSSSSGSRGRSQKSRSGSRSSGSGRPPKSGDGRKRSGGQRKRSSSSNRRQG